jgi:hypothetical protein
MNERFEHELSQFLDGRLPSGRREQILERLGRDPAAADLLDEMERAQDLARTLPSHPIGRSFSETLWERIRAGEGTPDAVFREPLPFWTKARYVATGAAAAALLIAALQVLVPDEATQAVPAEPIARADGPPADAERALESAGPRRGLRPVGQPSIDTPFYLPLAVAEAGQSECVEAVSTLQLRAPEVERRIAAVAPRDLVVELAPVVGRARGSAELIRWMQRRDLLKLDAEFDTTLAMAERILERFQRADTDNDAMLLRVAVRDLRDLQLDGLRQKFDISCCTPAEEFLQGLQEQVLRNPDLGRSLRFEVTTEHGAGARFLLDEPAGAGFPFGGSILILRGFPGSGGGLQVFGRGRAGAPEIQVDAEDEVRAEIRGLTPRRGR